MSGGAERKDRREQEIRRVLLREWDPIGVKDVPEAQDEYDSYVPDVLRLLARRASARAVFDYLWWLETELPGDESEVGWGPDPAPHIHYDVRCDKCKQNDAFPGTKYQYWSKFYAEEICEVPQCGSVNKQEHLSQRTEGPDGETVYRYNFVLPPQGK